MDGLRASSPESRRKALDEVCRRYWKPMYRYARIAWAASNEDAKDLTQAFLLWLVEGEALRDYDPEKGRFRPFLKLVLRRFVGHREEAMRRLKRGGSATSVGIDDADLIPDPGAIAPDDAFDRAWAVQVAGVAIETVRARFLRHGKGKWFQAYEAFDLAPGPVRPGYAAIAAGLGASEDDVRNWLREVREEIRAEIRGELAETVGRSHDLEAEWNELFGA